MYWAFCRGTFIKNNSDNNESRYEEVQMYFWVGYLQIDVSKIVQGFVEKLSIEPTSQN